MASKEHARRLDNDFMFYLDFTKDYHLRLPSGNERNLCTKWLNKLCADAAYGVEGRMVRNVWMAHLAICIQSNSLNKFFLKPPGGGPLPEYPDKPSKTIETPAWLDNLAGEDFSRMSRDGRTYLATQNLKDGRGAFAYLAVTLNDGEPEWLPQAGRQNLEKVLAHGFEYALGDLSQPDLPSVLASRKTIEQRKAVLDYYNDLLENIQGQLAGIVEEASSERVNDLIIRLVKGLRGEGRYQKYLSYPPRERYFRLLENLSRKIQRRIRRIERRELLLDEVERRLLGDSLFSGTLIDREIYTGPEWKDVVPAGASDDRIQKVEYLYPPELITTFLQLLKKEKRSIGGRTQRQHVDFVGQLREDLRREQQLGEAECDEQRARISELEAALELSNSNAQAALSPVARNLAKDIKETENLLGKLHEENIKLTKKANELVLKVHQ